MSVFTLKIDQDAMEVRLITVPASPFGVPNAEDLEKQLTKESIFSGIDRKEIARAFEELPQAAIGEEFVIARGTPPIQGKNGQIDFLVNVSGKPIYDGAALSDAEVEHLEQIDYKNATRIVAVKVGQKVAIVHPPTDGVAGKSLSGKTLPARNGKAAQIHFGNGVGFAGDGITVVATNEGRPVYSGKTLEISDTYEVPGDVGYDTGNIKFDGYVVIRGNVQDDFSVEARNLEIYGIVGAAKVICRGNLIAHGGINGRNRAVITCAGTADVKYIINCPKFELKQDLNVAKEIANSIVWCRGTVRAGKIMGGEILAFRGIEAKLLGTEMGTPTLLAPGANYEISRVDDTLKIFSLHLSHLVKSIGPNFGEHKYFLNLSKERQEEMRQLYDIFMRLKTAHDKLNLARKQILLNSTVPPLPIVAALKLLCHDVTIRTTKCVRRFLDAVRGPVVLVEDVNNSTIRVDGYTTDPFTYPAAPETAEPPTTAEEPLP